MHDPSIEAWDAGIDVLTYLLSVKHLGITYDGNNPNLIAFSDSSWNQTPNPFGGHVVMIAGGAISFQARKLKIVPQSSAEAETAIYARCCKDVDFLINILGSDGMQLDINLPVSIYCDNSAAVSHVKDVGAKSRTRHYERWLQYGREHFLRRRSVPEWVPTTIQVADIFTKPLDPTTFRKFRAALLNIRGADHMPSELITLLGY